MKRRAFLLLVTALLLAGCAGRERVPSFIDAAGRRQPLALEEGGLYRLRTPAWPSEQKRAFFLRLHGNADGIELRILDPERRVLASRSLQAAFPPLLLLVDLPLGAQVGGFSLGPGARAEVREAGFAEPLAGFERGREELRLGSGVRRLVLGMGGAEVELEAQAFQTEGQPPRWRIVLDYESIAPVSWAEFRRFESGAGEAAGRRALALLRLEGSGRVAILEQRALSGPQRLFLYPGTVGFVPLRLFLQPREGGCLEVRALRIEERLAEPDFEEAPGAPSIRPLAADPGTILLYDRGAWRQPDYELFVWARFPRVLILDTADYAVQDRFFKRLAFFVEKLGYRGRLVSAEEVVGLHGFNAHDYRAEDLARFYQAAAEAGDPLSAEERLLRRILTANGILRENGQPGSGAILSISRSSSGELRRLLLTHEALHGLYFVLPRYRQACAEVWQELGREEREFWLLFLRWWRYDYEDPFLAANEFQAYLLQQPRSGLGPYFHGLSAERLQRSFPQRASWIRGFLEAQPDSFERAYDRLDEALRREARLEGGRLVELDRAEPEGSIDKGRAVVVP